MKMIFYTGISTFYIVSLSRLKCSTVIALVLFIFFNINFCALVTIKLNVSLVYFFIWYMVFYPTRSSGGRGEALVRALVLHQCGPGSGLGM